jgi:hypothetical protein
MYLVQVSLLLIGQQDLLDFPQKSALDSHWLDDCVNLMPTPEENNQYSINHS